jgi:hypothetical protein
MSELSIPTTLLPEITMIAGLVLFNSGMEPFYSVQKPFPFRSDLLDRVLNPLQLAIEWSHIDEVVCLEVRWSPSNRFHPAELD